MSDMDKTKEQLRTEVAALRRRVDELEKSASGKGHELPIDPRDYCDALTGLPGRHLFDQHLSIITAQTPGQVRKFALMLFRIGCGEESGGGNNTGPDELLLKGVANRLKSLLRKSDILTRTGNNDFLILLPEATWMEISARIVPRIMNSFQKPFVFTEQALRIAVNIGIALCPGDSSDGGVLAEYSRLAVERAVKKGPNSYQFYGMRKNGNPYSVSSVNG